MRRPVGVTELGERERVTSLRDFVGGSARRFFMGILAYTLLTYAIMAVIAYLVMGLVVLTNRILTRQEQRKAEKGA